MPEAPGSGINYKNCKAQETGWQEVPRKNVHLSATVGGMKTVSPTATSLPFDLEHVAFIYEAMGSIKPLHYKLSVTIRAPPGYMSEQPPPCHFNLDLETYEQDFKELSWCILCNTVFSSISLLTLFPEASAITGQACREPRGARLRSPLGVPIFVSFDKYILWGDCSSSLIRVSSPGPWLFWGFTLTQQDGEVGTNPKEQTKVLKSTARAVGWAKRLALLCSPLKAAAFNFFLYQTHLTADICLHGTHLQFSKLPLTSLLSQPLKKIYLNANERENGYVDNLETASFKKCMVITVFVVLSLSYIMKTSR